MIPLPPLDGIVRFLTVKAIIAENKTRVTASAGRQESICSDMRSISRFLLFLTKITVRDFIECMRSSSMTVRIWMCSTLLFLASVAGGSQLADITALTRAYEDSNILFIGTPNHTNFKIYKYLEALLDRAKNDHRLRYIVFERFGDNSAFYRSLSVNELENVLKEGHFPSDLHLRRSLCGDEWAYAITNFFPYLRALNKQRPVPILAASLDGASSDQDLWWPNAGQYSPGNCIQQNPSLYFSDSANREATTAKNFASFYDRLGLEDKVIIVYHHGHLLKGFRSCRLFMETRGSLIHWTSNLTDLSWLSLFLKEKPDVAGKMSIVLFDEKDEWFNKDGAFKASSLVSHRVPPRSGVIDLQNVALKETGLQVFRESAFLNHYQEGQHKGDLRIDQLADYIVWNHDSADRYPLKESKYYLPNICKENREGGSKQHSGNGF